MSLISQKVRRPALAAAAAAGLLLATAACGGGSSDNTAGATGGSTADANAPATLTLWTNATTGPGLKYFQDAAKTFHTQYPNVTVKVQNIQNEDYDGKIQTALQAGQGSAPDVLFQRGGGKMQAMVDAGQLADISSSISADAKANISAGMFSMDSVDGKNYAMPLDMTPEGFWYSKDLFQKAGISGTPSTLDDLNADVTKLKQSGTTAIALGGKDGWPAAHYYYFFAIRDCSQDALNKAASSLTFDDPCFLQAGKDLQTFNATNPWESDPFNTSAQQGAGSSAGQVANHKAAMELMGAWEPGQIGALTPNQKPLPDLGYFPFPSVPNGQGDQTAMMAGSNAYSCSAWAPEPACGNFLNFLATTDQQKQYATAFGAIPANKAAQGGVTDPAAKAALDAANNASYSVLFLDTLYGATVGDALNSAVVDLMSGKSNDPQSIIDAVNNASSKG
jgi:raffinose/stachyose/melibiose transport system substrate-binding protein